MNRSSRPHFVITRAMQWVIGVVITGAVVIASIGFAGSYAAVKELALRNGFGKFAIYFPIGIDAGIIVLLALDLLMTWLRIPYPVLRQVAWLLTAATVVFNGAAAWPNPLAVAMHAITPVLFIVAVEAARHAVGRIADITADRHMESVRFIRWLLAPAPTLRLWRRMKLWELRSYEQVIGLERDRLVYQARLQARFGRAWRRKAPVEALMPLRLARYGVPLAETAPAGLAAAGITADLTDAGEGALQPQLTRLDSQQSGSSAEAESLVAGRTPEIESAGRTVRGNPDQVGRDESTRDESGTTDRPDSGADPRRPVGPVDPARSSADPTRSDSIVPGRSVDHPTQTSAARPTAESPDSQAADPTYPTEQVSAKSVGASRIGSGETPTLFDSTAELHESVGSDEAGQPTVADPTRPTSARSTDRKGNPIDLKLAAILDQARIKLADWPESDLVEEKVRKAMGVGAKRARFIRDELKAERLAAIDRT